MINELEKNEDRAQWSVQGSVLRSGLLELYQDLELCQEIEHGSYLSGGWH